MLTDFFDFCDEKNNIYWNDNFVYSNNLPTLKNILIRILNGNEINNEPAKNRAMQFIKETGAALKYFPLTEGETGEIIRKKLSSYIFEYGDYFTIRAIIKKSAYVIENNRLYIKGKDIFIESNDLLSKIASNNNQGMLFIYAVTLNPHLKEILDGFNEKGEIFEAYLLNSLCAAAVEQGADDLNQFINFLFDNNFTRFSPGYGDFSLENQKTIFNLLKYCDKIGLTLSDSYLMVPEKSTSGLII